VFGNGDSATDCLHKLGSLNLVEIDRPCPVEERGPKPRTGAFATVYKLQNGHRAWAVRCFNREVRDQQDRYRAISQHLDKAALPFTFKFHFLPNGIRVAGRAYPILKMDWLNGEPLNIGHEAHHRLGNLEDRRKVLAFIPRYESNTRHLYFTSLFLQEYRCAASSYL
jgi:hypothetical protein